MTTITTGSKFYDNTKLSSYKTCPRSFQLRHILNITPDRAAVPLVFGSSWHAAMDIVWQHAKEFNQADLRKYAALKFIETWEEGGMPADMSLEDIERFSPRTPSVAEEMLLHYIDQRWRILQNCEIIACEQPFAVPLPACPDVWYVGRLDKVISHDGQILVIEHKTTSEYKIDGGFRQTYIEGWDMDSQVKGYEYGAALFFGAEQVWVDAALVHKKVHDKFRFIPVSHQRGMLDEWIESTVEWVVRVGVDVDNGYFPKNENSCVGKYGPCQFTDICRSCSKPSELTETPFGYRVEPWTPFEVLGLESLIKQGEQDAQR